MVRPVSPPRLPPQEMAELSQNWKTLKEVESRYQTTKEGLGVLGKNEGKGAPSRSPLVRFDAAAATFLSHHPFNYYSLGCPSLSRPSLFRFISSSAAGAEILVPLTASLYVPGTIVEADKVLVDIGTGYFVEKTRPDAVELLDRKIALIQQNAESYQDMARTKQQNLQAIVEMMRMRLNSQPQQAGGR